MAKPKRTRIQREKREVILNAGLQVFSENGFRGTTLDQIAEVAGLSKPNMLYYFPNKEEIYTNILQDILEVWFIPLEEINESGDPLDQIRAYIRAKMEMSRKYPQQSRMFANEILHGAPRIATEIVDQLNSIVDKKVAIIERWIAAGKIADVNPHHLLFAVWATTQHYADFAVQIDGVLRGSDEDPIATGTNFLEGLFMRGLAPK